jgi:cell division protein FtsW
MASRDQATKAHTGGMLARPITSFYILIVSSGALSILGLIMVFSSSSIYSLESKGSTYAIVLRQLIFLAISIPLALYVSKLSLKNWKLISRLGLILSVGLLLALQIPGLGKTVKGNTNWISLKVIDVQPSELAKLFIILWASYMLANKENSGRTRFNVLFQITPGFVAVMILVMLGRDLGTTCVIAAILGGMLFISGIELKVFGWIIGLGSMVFAFFIATASYRVDRFLVVLNPFAEGEYKNAGWQPAHSLLGLASGGIFGVGLGGSRQKWGNLAEAHTDFIFSIIGEELGLIGALAVLFLLVALIYSIFKISLRAKDPLTRYACAGIACWFGVQILLNVGSATSLLPVVGVTLPLISYGGSALISSFLALGFVLGASLRDPQVRDELLARTKSRKQRAR